jgi:hypothetical protein
MAKSLTGKWKLNKDKCTSQRDVLKLMNRKFWEVSAIDKADEDFEILHFLKKMEDGKTIHYLEKFVVIYLDSSVLKILSAIFPIDIDKVKYSHKLVANNKEKKHDNDEKQFGPCSSRTTWEKNHENHEGFTIRWYLKMGILKVFHFVNNNNELQVELEMTKPNGESAKAIKIYERQKQDQERLHYIEKLPYKSDLV